MATIVFDSKQNNFKNEPDDRNSSPGVFLEPFWFVFEVDVDHIKWNSFCQQCQNCPLGIWTKSKMK